MLKLWPSSLVSLITWKFHCCSRCRRQREKWGTIRLDRDLFCTIGMCYQVIEIFHMIQINASNDNQDTEWFISSTSLRLAYLLVLQQKCIPKKLWRIGTQVVQANMTGITSSCLKGNDAVHVFPVSSYTLFPPAQTDTVNSHWGISWSR